MTTQIDVDIRRQEILAAAATLIAERGYHSVRIADIAAVVGTSTGAVHYYFPSKSDVLSAALHFAIDRAFDRQSAELRRIDSAHDRLLKLIDMQLPRIGAVREEWTIWLQFWSESAIRPELRTTHNQYYERWHEAIVRIVTRGVQQGVYRGDVDPEEFAYELAAMTDGLAIRVMLNTSGLAVSGMRELLVGFVTRTLVS